MNSNYAIISGIVLSGLLLAACKPQPQSLPESSINQPLPAVDQGSDVIEIKGTDKEYMPGEKELYGQPKPAASSSATATMTPQPSTAP